MVNCPDTNVTPLHWIAMCSDDQQHHCGLSPTFRHAKCSWQSHFSSSADMPGSAGMLSYNVSGEELSAGWPCCVTDHYFLYFRRISFISVEFLVFQKNFCALSFHGFAFFWWWTHGIWKIAFLNLKQMLSTQSHIVPVMQLPLICAEMIQSVFCYIIYPIHFASYRHKIFCDIGT